MKRSLRELLQSRDLDMVADVAARNRRILGLLASLTYVPDPLLGWRAVEAMGIGADRIAEDDPDFVREHLRRLHWLLNEESGGICWRAPEAMAEIVRHRPVLFADYIPIVASLVVNLAEEDLERFRVGALWAIGRLGALAGDHIQAVLPTIRSALENPDPQVRGMAAWCLGQVGHAKLLSERPDLLGDDGPVDLYEDGVLHRTTVARLLQQAIRNGPVKE